MYVSAGLGSSFNAAVASTSARAIEALTLGRRQLATERLRHLLDDRIILEARQAGGRDLVRRAPHNRAVL
jgi:uncharacterized protein (UPF0262 family)